MFVYVVRRGRDQLLLAESAPGAVCERARVPRATDCEPRLSSSGLPRPPLLVPVRCRRPAAS